MEKHVTEKTLDDINEFEVKEEHLKLFRETYVSWFFCERGAPHINPKRPYGNSDVETDVLEILDMKASHKNIEYAAKLHDETHLALAICLITQSFKAGKYIKVSDGKHPPALSHYSRKWVLVDNEPSITK